MPVDRSTPDKVVESYLAARFAIDLEHHERSDQQGGSRDLFEKVGEVHRDHSTYIAHAGSIGWPSRYTGRVIKVQSLTDDRVEVEAIGAEKRDWVDDHFLFIVERRDDGWRLSAEYSIDDDGVVYEFWREIDRRLVHSFDEHVAAFFDKQDRLAEVVGENDWQYDTDRGTLSFGREFAWHAQILGSESQTKFTWRWGWANPASDLPERSIAWARRLKEFGEKEQLIDLTTPSFPLGGTVDGWFLLPIATGLLKAPAAYRAPQDGNLTVFLIIDDPLFPSLLPSQIDTVERILKIFRTATEHANDPRRAFKAYLKYYSLQAETDGQTIRGLRGGRPVLEAKFDDRNQLTDLHGIE